MILLLDNFDSFTYNIYQMAGELNPDIVVYRNNAITIEQITALQPSHIILSPGPGYPAAAGIMPAVITAFAATIPMLGVCLGHQGIAQAFGGRIIQAPVPVHGKQSRIQVQSTCPLFKGLTQSQLVGRYHSLIVDRESLPECLAVTATSEDGLIMGLQHRQYPVFGVQFHPESILTESGAAMLKAFINL